MKLETTPLLRQHARIIIPGPEFSTIVEDMWGVMEANNGVGLAAPQVGLPYSLFVAALPEYGRVAMANVKHVADVGFKSNDLVTKVMTEGCLSLPGRSFDVERPIGVAVAWTDPVTGEVDAKDFWGWEARIVQHELDHLSGVLIDCK
jgi:peptide deformylase